MNTEKMCLMETVLLIVYNLCIVIWSSMTENLTLLYVNNKGADHHVQPFFLITTSVVRATERIIPVVAICKKSRF